MGIFLGCLMIVILLIGIRFYNDTNECVHDWENRAMNRWWIPTYRVCKKCDQAQERKVINDEDRWLNCDKDPELDAAHEEFKRKQRQR